MPRPCKCRYIETDPPEKCFRPSRCARPPRDSIMLYLDEVEAMRLSDIEGLTQEEAAARMEISRATFARLVDKAHRKLAEAILHGRAVTIEQIPGGENVEKRKFMCGDCKHEWELEFGTGCPKTCPSCGGTNYQRTNCGHQYQRGGGQCGGGMPHTHPHGQHGHHGQGQCCK